MYTVKPTTQFQKDVKLVTKRGYRIDRLTEVIKKIAGREVLDEKYKDHSLRGNYKRCRECHIAPDWLLIYEIMEDDSIIYLIRTGTHSDLFL